MSLDEPAPRPGLVANVQQCKQDQADVRDEELGHAPRQKRGEALGENDDDVEKDAVPRQPRLRGGLVWQLLRRDALHAKCPAEEEVRDVDRGPRDEASYTRNVHEPVEHRRSALRLVEEAEEAPDGRAGDGVVGNTPRGRLHHPAGCETLLRQADENTRARVDVGNGCTEDDREEDGVDDVRKHSHAGQVHSNDKRRAGSVVLATAESLVGVRNDCTSR